MNREKQKFPPFFSAEGMKAPISGSPSKVRNNISWQNSIISIVGGNCDASGYSRQGVQRKIVE
jgi:hypothetical protein